MATKNTINTSTGNASTRNLPTGIAIQGYEGSFHQVAARHYFGREVEVIPCDTFPQVVRLASSRKESAGGLMAIENSIAGSILPNYNLLQKSNLQITGEIYLQIRQNLLVNPGVKLEDIREVHSHTMALQQCYGFLDKYNWKLVETEDTALSARLLHQHKSKHVAAIASRLAAELYQLEVIAPNIHTLKNNYTRFLVLEPTDGRNAAAEHVAGEHMAAEYAGSEKGPGANKAPKANKASVNFHTDHSRGSLARVLTCIAEGGINLSKLQSFPIPGSEFNYSFHADMEFDSTDQFLRVIALLKPLTEHVKVYGIYQRGLWK